MLDIDDLYRCVGCGHWHPLYIKYPQGSDDDEARRLYFECPRLGTFYGGRVGEPPQDPARWERA